jgi:hypothetical protein
MEIHLLSWYIICTLLHSTTGIILWAVCAGVLESDMQKILAEQEEKQ